MRELVHSLALGAPALIGAFIGVGGGALVALISTGRTLGGQRLLARDQALRQWRSNLMEPILQYLKETMQLLDGIQEAVLAGDMDGVKAVMEKIVELESTWNNSQVILPGDDALSIAFGEFEHAARDYIRVFQRGLSDDAPPEISNARLNDAHMVILSCHRRLYRQIENFMFFKPE